MDKNEQNLNFLQSEEWRKFQESVGRETFFVENDEFSASIIEHNLPIVGKYFYCPRGPIFLYHSERSEESRNITGSFVSLRMTELVELAKKENAGWIRIDPENEENFEVIKNNIDYKINKAPHDMQPKEIFVIDISKPEEQLLAEMKSKTRYNINLAKNKNVKVISHQSSAIDKKHVEAFLRLTKEMAERNGIATHPEEYYRKMIEVLPENMLKIYMAEFEGKIIAANLILFFGNTATYLHGASGNEHRNVMAPHLLQWQAILDAKKAGYKFYDFGGIKTSNVQTSKRQTSNDWAGITKFKQGFSLATAPVVFPGSYDIIINPFRYWLYRLIQKIKSFVK